MFMRSMGRTALVLAALVLLALPAAAATAPELEWQQCLGGSGYDEAFAIEPTTDGGYIAAGSTTSINGNVSGNHGASDIWVVKLTRTGEMVWQHCLGGSEDEYAYAVLQTADGGYLVAGTASSNDGDVSGLHGANDAWVVKLSGSGELVWQRCLGGTDYDGAYAVERATDGGYVVAGSTRSTDGDVSGNHGGSDMWAVRLTDAGETAWQHCLGGTGDESADSVQSTVDGGYIVSGSTDSNSGDVSGNHGGDDAWVVKLSGSGALAWQRCLGGTKHDYAYVAQETADGGYILIGGAQSADGDVEGNHGDFDTWVVKLDGVGVPAWQSCLGGSRYEEAFAVQQTADGGYLVASDTYSNDGDVRGNHGDRDIWLVLLTGSGETAWQRCLGGTAEDWVGAGALVATDGGYVLAGATASNDGDVGGNHGGFDAWIVRLGPPYAAFSANATSGSVPMTVAFTDESSPMPYHRWWTFGDGSGTVDANPVHTYTKAGTYTVNLTVWTTSGSASTSKAGYVTVGADSRAPVADFSLSRTSGTAPFYVKFTDSSTNATSWRWDFGGLAWTTAKSPSVVFRRPGTYTVTLVATNAYGSSTRTSSLTVTGAAPRGTKDSAVSVVG